MSYITGQRAQATATYYEHVAHALQKAAYELAQLRDIENVSYWEWDQHQPSTQPLRLPVEFTHWTLTKEAELLEARARILRGGR